jgi:L-phenylalanine/L-methionine N-acetyltransferase
MNIEVRRATVDDAEALQRIFDTPRAIWGTLQIPYTSAEARRKRLADSPDGSYPLVALVDGEVVGELTLYNASNSPRRRHAGGLGMAVRDDWQGKGVGTALMHACIELADNWLNLSRLELDVYTDNEPGIRLYKKFGFEIEGTLKKFAFRDGEFVDVYAMARLRF